MDYCLIYVIIGALITVHNSGAVVNSDHKPDVNLDLVEEPPEGYYAFVESPNAEPPKVRRPPYVQSDKECPGLKKNKGKINPHVYKTLSLCGDLNKGYIPRNPMHQNVLGTTYPFELIKNKTLQFFSKVLPVLKADETLPKVAKYQQFEGAGNKIDRSSRTRRSLEKSVNVTSSELTDSVSPNNAKSAKRAGRKLCDNNDGVLCLLYKAFQGESGFGQTFFDRKDDQVNNEAPEFRRGETTLPAVPKDKSLPPTPCPAKVEYATPVFARNYQGVWRYVVQIPYEGYFTQTIEVTRCLNSRCHYMDGSCVSSPRWTSILVAEIYYPDTYLPSKPTLQSPGSSWSSQSYRNPVSSENPPPVQDFQNYQQYLQKRAGLNVGNESSGLSESKKSLHCDGVDEIGCFQVRLYYDWFLVPGSCKCWKPDYFTRYLRRKVTSPEL